MAKEKQDVPTRDDDFYTFIKKIIKVLLEVTPPPVMPKWQAWNIPEADFREIREAFEGAPGIVGYEELYLIAQAKQDRTAADVDAHRTKRKEVEPLLRQFIKEHLRFQRIVPRIEKVHMGLIPADTEPSVVHGSHLTMGTPEVKIENMKGAIGAIDVRFKKPSDQTRGSVPKGYGAEFRYVLDEPLPPDPEDIPGKTTVLSSKARFQISVGTANAKKTMRGYARWRHKTNPALNSAWTQVMEINIA